MSLTNERPRSTAAGRARLRPRRPPLLVPRAADRLAATVLDRVSRWLTDPVSATVAVVGAEPLVYLDAARRIGWRATAVAPGDRTELDDRCHHVVGDLADLSANGCRPSVGMWIGAGAVPPSVVGELAAAVGPEGVVVLVAGTRAARSGMPSLTPADVSAGRAALAGHGLELRDEWYPPGIRRQVVLIAATP